MWSEIFFTQAKSDWQVYEHLDKTAFPKCHALHYLQMATEKLAKAYLLAGQSQTKYLHSTHQALTRFLQDIYRNRGLQIEMAMTAKQLRTYVRHLLSLAYEIEHLAPKLAGGGPNPEYPWEAPKGTFYAPAAYEFTIMKSLLEPRGHKLLKLIQLAVEKFDILH